MGGASNESAEFTFDFDEPGEEAYALVPLPTLLHGMKYSPEISLWMALCARTAYHEEKSARRIFGGAGFETVATIHREGTEAYLAWHPNGGNPFAVLAFRGTKIAALRELLGDILARLLRRRVRNGDDLPDLKDLWTDLRARRRSIPWVGAARMLGSSRRSRLSGESLKRSLPARRRENRSAPFRSEFKRNWGD